MTLLGLDVSNPATLSAADRAPATAGSSDRVFGFVFAGFFLVLGVVPRLRGGDVRLWALLTAAGFALIALVFPRALAWPNRGWTKFGALLHRVTSPVALTLIYLVGVAPMGLLMRLFGKDPLRLKPRPELETYWIARVPPARADARMKQQF